MSGKSTTENIWVILVIIFYCCPTVTILLKHVFNNDAQCCGEIACQAGEEIILRKCVFCSSICGRNKNEGSVEVHSTLVFSI